MISFNIHFLSKLLSKRNYSSVVILMDNNTEKHCYPLLLDLLKGYPVVKIVLTPGEIQKQWISCEKILDVLIKNNIDRSAVILNLGGGVITDMGGFVASVYKRGIDFINLPTTLLSMVDAAVGGKTGIDYKGYKNFIGVFQNATSVIIHPLFLETLPQNQLYAGWAEMLKHGLIAHKKYFFDLIKQEKPEEIKIGKWKKLIKTSLEIKQEIVEQDPLDKGLRSLLNFGHTIGHALETFYLLNSKKPILHGEAVAVGMLEEAKLSVVHGQLSHEDYLTIENALNKYYATLFSEVSKVVNDKKWIKYLLHDKKNSSGKLKVTLLKKIGKGMHHCAIDINLLR